MRTLRNLYVLIQRELYSYFCSPIAYIFLVMFLALLSVFTFADNLGSFYQRGVADLALPFFTWHPWLFVMFVPAVGMRMWAEELNQGTLELLCTMPLALWQAIVAKFMAGVIFLALALALTFPVVLTANYLGDPDNGKILCGYIGSLFMATSFLALSSFTSSLTRNQVISFIVTMVVCILLVLCGFPPIVNMLRQWFSEGTTQVISSWSIYTHFDMMQRGMIDTRDIVYFATVTILGLSSTWVVLRNR